MNNNNLNKNFENTFNRNFSEFFNNKVTNKVLSGTYEFGKKITLRNILNVIRSNSSSSFDILPYSYYYAHQNSSITSSFSSSSSSYSKEKEEEREMKEEEIIISSEDLSFFTTYILRLTEEKITKEEVEEIVLTNNIDGINMFFKWLRCVDCTLFLMIVTSEQNNNCFFKTYKNKSLPIPLIFSTFVICNFIIVYESAIHIYNKPSIIHEVDVLKSLDLRKNYCCILYSFQFCIALYNDILNCIVEEEGIYSLLIHLILSPCYELKYNSLCLLNCISFTRTMNFEKTLNTSKFVDFDFIIGKFYIDYDFIKEKERKDKGEVEEKKKSYDDDGNNIIVTEKERELERRKHNIFFILNYFFKNNDENMFLCGLVAFSLLLVKGQKIPEEFDGMVDFFLNKYKFLVANGFMNISGLCVALFYLFSCKGL